MLLEDATHLLARRLDRRLVRVRVRVRVGVGAGVGVRRATEVSWHVPSVGC